MSGAWYEQAAVSLGLLAAHEVGDGSDLSVDLLAKRFLSEARSLKEPKKNFGGLLGGCSNPQVHDGPDASGPSATDIDSVLQSWLTRLRWEKKGDDVRDALLQSKALDIVLQTLTTCRTGRTAIQVAAQNCSGGECQRPLGVVLVQMSFVPTTLLGMLLKLLAEAIEVVELCRESGMQSAESESAERGKEWVLTLLSTALRDICEVDLLKKGSAVESLDRAFPLLSAESKPALPEKILDRAETWSRIFLELKDLCHQLMQAKPNSLQGDQEEAQRNLSGKADALTKFRESMERPGQMRSQRGKKLFLDVARASMELEAVVKVRADKARLIARALPKLLDHKLGVAALCLHAESERSRHLMAVHSELHRVVWGAQADVMWEDGTALPVLRAIVKRTLGLAEQSRREMVHLAADCLDDNNALQAKSEEMSRSSNSYKALVAELQKTASRIGKMEESSKGKIVKSGVEAASMWKPVVPAPLQDLDATADEKTREMERRRCMHELHKMLCLAAGSPPPSLPTPAHESESSSIPTPVPAPKARVAVTQKTSVHLDDAQTGVSQKSSGPIAAPKPEPASTSLMVTTPGGIPSTDAPPQPVLTCGVAVLPKTEAPGAFHLRPSVGTWLLRYCALSALPEQAAVQKPAATIQLYSALASSASASDVNAALAALDSDSRRRLSQAFQKVIDAEATSSIGKQAAALTLQQYAALAANASASEIDAALSALESESRRRLLRHVGA